MGENPSDQSITQAKQTNSKNQHQHIRAIKLYDNDEPPALQPQYASDNEEDNKHIENNNTGVIQDMHKFDSALTLEEDDPIHGGHDYEAVGDDDNLEEEMDDIDREKASVMKEQVASSTHDVYERRNINIIIYFFDNLEKYPNILERTISSQMEAARAKDIQRRKKKWPAQ